MPRSFTRRRLVFTLTFAAILLGLLYRYFTRGVDQRLVGTWLVTGTQFKEDVVWKLDSSGGAELYFLRNEKRIWGVRYSWKVRSTTLESSSFNDQRTFPTRISREWEILWSKLMTGKSPVTEHFEIVDVGPDAIVLMNEQSERITMRRINE